MKLVGKKLDGWLQQYGHTRKVIKGVAETDKELRLRVRKIFKEDEEFLPYLELKFRRTSAPTNVKDEDYWDDEHFDAYKQLLNEAADAAGEEVGQTSLDPHKGRLAHTPFDEEGGISKPAGKVPEPEERYQDDFARMFRKGPDAVYRAFQQSLMTLVKNTGRKPTEIYLTEEAHEVLNPVFDKLDEFSDVRAIVRGSGRVRGARIYTRTQGSPWQFVI